MCSRPRTLRRTRPAPSSTRMCFDVELREIGNALATSVTRASDSARRARMARRVASETAEKTRSSMPAEYSPIEVNIAAVARGRNPHPPGGLRLDYWMGARTGLGTDDGPAIPGSHRGANQYTARHGGFDRRISRSCLVWRADCNTRPTGFTTSLVLQSCVAASHPDLGRSPRCECHRWAPPIPALTQASLVTGLTFQLQLSRRQSRIRPGQRPLASERVGPGRVVAAGLTRARPPGRRGWPTT